MLDHGAPVTGIGAQCHIGPVTDIVNFKKRFDQLAQFGLPIKITEFDMGAKSVSDQQYAVEISKMLRLAFSHPAIEGFIFWGITEPTWVPESIASLIREDKTPRIAADSVYHLIHEVWTTKIRDITGMDGFYTFNGYYGDYEILVKVDSAWKKFSIPCLKANRDSIFILNLDDGKPAGPVLKKLRLYAPSTVELSFDKPMADPSEEYGSFRVFDKSANYVKSAALKEGDPKTIVLTMNASFKDKAYIPVSYFPGNVKSADGGMLDFFGPLQDETLTPAFISARTSENGKFVYIAFNGKIEENSVDPGNFVVRVGSQNVPVSSASLSISKDTIYLSLANQITSSSVAVLVGYVPGNLSTTDSLYVAAFESKTVSNVVAEVNVVSVVTDFAGTEIRITFSQAIANPEENLDFFSLQHNGKIITINKAALNLGNKRMVILSLDSVIHTGESVNLQYTPGTLVSSAEMPVPYFSVAVINRSTITASDEIEFENTEAYPNPFKDRLILTGISGFDRYCLSDMTGRIILESELPERGTAEINTSGLNDGVYFLILSGKSDRIVRKLVKK
jgi:uncharacterized repeat protein (TIGR02059 family)